MSSPGGWPGPGTAAPWLRSCDVVVSAVHRRRRIASSETPGPGPGPTRALRAPRTARLEAALFVAEGALSAKKLQQIATLIDVAEVHSLIEQLNAAYDASGCAFRVERVASGFRLLTRAQFAPWLDRLHRRQARLKLSSPALETLTVIAYRQPVTRAELETVRGVQSAEMLKLLMERGLVKIVGEDPSLGRPYLYGTTRLFLETYGLRRLEDLPHAGELSRVKGPAGQADGDADDDARAAEAAGGDAAVASAA